MFLLQGTFGSFLSGFTVGLARSEADLCAAEIELKGGGAFMRVYDAGLL